MEVILKEDVPKLGSRGDVVKVAEGYGRNFLLPKKLAIEASAGNKAVIEQMKAAAVRRSAKEKASAEALSKQFDGLAVNFFRRSGEHDQLFGSVTSGDIAEALEKKGLQDRPAQSSATRAVEEARRVDGSCQAAQGRNGTPEGRHRKRGGSRVATLGSVRACSGRGVSLRRVPDGIEGCLTG